MQASDFLSPSGSMIATGVTSLATALGGTVVVHYNIPLTAPEGMSITGMLGFLAGHFWDVKNRQPAPPPPIAPPVIK